MPTLDVLRQWRQSLVLPDSVLVPLPCLPLFYFFLAGSLPLSLRYFDQIELPMSILLLVALPALGFLFLPRPYWKWILAAVPALADHAAACDSAVAQLLRISCLQRNRLPISRASLSMIGCRSMIRWSGWNRHDLWRCG